MCLNCSRLTASWFTIRILINETEFSVSLVFEERNTNSQAAFFTPMTTALYNDDDGKIKRKEEKKFVTFLISFSNEKLFLISRFNTLMSQLIKIFFCLDTCT